MEEIRRALTEHDLERAERVAHTVRGVAGMGAKDLHAAAATVEASLRHLKPGETEPDLFTFEAALQRVVSLIGAIRADRDGKSDLRANRRSPFVVPEACPTRISSQERRL